MIRLTSSLSSSWIHLWDCANRVEYAGRQVFAKSASRCFLSFPKRYIADSSEMKVERERMDYDVVIVGVGNHCSWIRSREVVLVLQQQFVWKTTRQNRIWTFPCVFSKRERIWDPIFSVDVFWLQKEWIRLSLRGEKWCVFPHFCDLVGISHPAAGCRRADAFSAWSGAFL